MIGHCPNRTLLGSRILLILLLISVVFVSCTSDFEYDNTQSNKVNRDYKTKNVIVVVVDGLRFSESWCDSTHRYMPHLAGLMANEGIVNNKFYNLGETYTLAGHTSLTTGIYQAINNAGEELPNNPSIFQYWNQVYQNNQVKSWIITSKDKLAVLADTQNPYWKGAYVPSANCGVGGLGLGSGYREDSLTLKTAIGIFKEYQPNLVLINFRDPDYSAHSGVWSNYVDGVRKSDEYVYRLWEFFQNDPNYKNTTTLFVTSDHGRHLDSVADGFVSHGDGCEGCRHLGFFAFGPDFKKGLVILTNRSQIDIPATIAGLLGFSLPNSKGEVMTELFGRK